MPGPEKSMRQRMLDGELYIADDEIGRDYVRAQELTRRINALPVTEGETKRKLLTELLGGLGEETDLRPPIHFDYGYQTTFGARSFVNFPLLLLKQIQTYLAHRVNQDHLQIYSLRSDSYPLFPTGGVARRQILAVSSERLSENGIVTNVEYHP